MTYLCHILKFRPFSLFLGLRESRRYMHDQDWLKEGQLARFPYLPHGRRGATGNEQKRRASPVLKCAAALTGDLHNITNVLNAVKRKVGVAR